MTKKPIILSIICLAMSSALWGKGFTYEVMSPPQNFPSSVTCMYSNPGSFVWMGTPEGLLRLDYRHFKLYSGEAVPGNAVRAITGDSNGDILILTDGGIARYDRVNDNFDKVSDLSAGSFCTTDSGVLFGGSNALQFYDSATGAAAPVRNMDPSTPFSVDCIFPYGGDYLILDLQRGFLRYSPSSDTFLQAPLNITGSSCAFMDSNLHIWRSVYNEGVECYDVTGRLLAKYDMSNSALTSNLVTGFAESDGKIWVSTRYGSVCTVDMQTGAVETLMGNRSDVNRFPSNDLVGIYGFSDGTVWAARSRGGVIAIRRRSIQSYYISPVITSEGGISQSVRCLAHTPGEDLVWMGTGSAGLHSISISSGKVEYHPSVGSKSVTAMANLSAGKLLLYSYGEGLYVFDKSTGSISPFKYTTPSLEQFIHNSGNSVRLCNTPDGQVIIVADVVHIYDPASGNARTFDCLSHDFSDVLLPVFGSTVGLCHDSHRFGVLDPSAAGCRMVFDMGDRIVRSASQAPDRSIWVLTSDALGKLESDYSKFTPVEGINVSNTNTVVCDSAGRVWLGTDGSLGVYDPLSGRFLEFSTSDGVLPNVFSPEARLVTDDGTMMLGGNGGLCEVDLSTSFDNQEVPVISLLEATVDGKVVTSSMPRILPSSTKSVTVRIFASESDMLRHKKFRFHVTCTSGLDQVVETGAPELTLHSRTHGKYVITASCSMPSGDWTEPVEVYSWRMNPVWYRNVPLILSILALMGLVTFYMLYTHFQRKAQRSLHEADTDRIRFLLNVSHELKTPLTLIIGPLERALSSMQKTDPMYSRLAGAHRQAMRMRTLILTVLDAHKIEEGAASLNAEEVDYNAWVKDLANQFADEMESRNIKLVSSFDPAVAKVPIDAPKLENVMTNLLVNAMKHSPNDSTVTVGTEIHGGLVRTFVSDTGSGLGNVDSSKLFSRYYQGITEKTGSGMGLAYANTIVELHSGTMGAKSNDGPGATFWFEIPFNREVVCY